MPGWIHVPKQPDMRAESVVRRPRHMRTSGHVCRASYLYGNTDLLWYRDLRRSGDLRRTADMRWDRIVLRNNDLCGPADMPRQQDLRRDGDVSRFTDVQGNIHLRSQYYLRRYVDMSGNRIM